MRIPVRPAAEADPPALLTVNGELNPDDGPLPQASADAVWAATASRQGRTVLVADADGTVAGTADRIVVPNLTRGGRSLLFVRTSWWPGPSGGAVSAVC
ncbi:hypothetical protein [Streptomyces sp. NPDC058766]|uniref:hypothetical protein n=1 Tax=Streptomyces sp. NPDC058766 TaxID=3346630 RepID=UPI0036B2ACB7